MFDRAEIAKAQQHALDAYPNEAVGLMVSGAYVPVENTAADPTKEFAFDEALIVQYGAGLQGVIHSHPDWYPVPSEADMALQQALELPFGIISTDGKGFTPPTYFGTDVPKGPLVGRGFIHGIQDCVAVIIDWHAERGIVLPDPPRSWGWWLPKDGQPAKDLYRDNYEPYGFVPIDGPREGAVFLVPVGNEPIYQKNERGVDVQIGKKPVMIPNHGGIYTGGKILHHIADGTKPIDMTRLSRHDPLSLLRGISNTNPIWFRHKDLP